MIQNAFTFNRKGSIVYKDAQQMSKLFDEYVSALENFKSVYIYLTRLQNKDYYLYQKHWIVLMNQLKI